MHPTPRAYPNYKDRPSNLLPRNLSSPGSQPNQDHPQCPDPGEGLHPGLPALEPAPPSVDNTLRALIGRRQRRAGGGGVNSLLRAYCLLQAGGGHVAGAGLQVLDSGRGSSVGPECRWAVRLISFR